jgi:hypothetical protein
VARDQGKQTRLQGELAHRYAAATPAKKKQPGQSSLTEELAEKQEGEVEAEVEQEQEAGVEADAPELLAEPKKSLFELPRKEPIRPSLLGGGIEVDPGPAAPAAPKPAASAKPGAPTQAPAPTPGKKSSTTRRG